MKYKDSSKKHVCEVVKKIIDGKFSHEFKRIAQKVERDKTLNKTEIVYLLSLKNSADRKALFALANAVRYDAVGKTVLIKGIVEFSNYCKKNCAYCGIRSQCKVKRYRMSPEEIIETAVEASKYGIDTIILQSGEDPFYSANTLVEVIKKIRKRTSKTISLSIGEREVHELKLFKEAGASRYLLKQETVNRNIFESVHGDDYEKRIFLLKTLVSLGYITGGGDIIGLPGQRVEDIADDIIFLRDIGAKMAGIGPLIPTKGTPLEFLPFGSAELTLNAYACTRLVIPDVLLPSTTALGTVDSRLQFAGFDAGCNVIMVNFTPERYRKGYRIYDNKRKVEFFETVSGLLERGEELSPEILRVFEEASA